jgi:hypothetical protein
VKWTGDSAIIAPSLVAERGHVDEIVDALRRTLAAGLIAGRNRPPQRSAAALGLDARRQSCQSRVMTVIAPRHDRDDSATDAPRPGGTWRGRPA